MGEVWLAQDTLLERQVAIKYLNAPNMAMYRELFMAEARMLARLKHPGITTLYDAAFEDERCYLIMEYVPGHPLSTLLSRQHLGIDEVLDIAIKILQALQYAHTHGVIHRDIKPDNVIADGDIIKLTDFGFANLVSILQEGSDYQLGTPAYMSPEQIEGQPTDARSDLYAFGVMLFEMLSGSRLPFERGEDIDAIFEAHLSAPPASIRTYLPDIPPNLEYTVNRLLAKKPEDRYPSAEALLNVLSTIRARLKFSKTQRQMLPPGDKPVVGRAGELEQLASFWNRVREMELPELAIVEGHTGMGKSRLIAEFLNCHVIDRGYPALVGRCDEYGLPYTPYADIISAIFETYPTVSSIIPERERQNLLAQIPGLARLLNMEREPAALAPRQAQLELFETILAILAKLGPLTLFFENANHLDESSAALLRFLLQRSQAPLFIVAACRNDQGEIAWLKNLTIPYHSLPLAALSDLAVEQIMSGILGGQIADSARQAVIRRGHGNPFFTAEITRFLQNTGEICRNEAGAWQYRRIGHSGSLPPTLISIFQQRVQRLSNRGRLALAVAAVIGPEFEYDAWLAALDNDADLTLASLDEALSIGVLQDVDGEQYTFSPSNLARILAEQLPVPRRRFLHTRIAGWLASKQPNVDPARLGYHYEQAGLLSEAARCWLQVGAKAAAANATREAIEHYRHSITLHESVEGYEALGNLARQQGDFGQAIDHFLAALELARQEKKDTPAMARLLNGLAFAYWLHDRYREAYRSAKNVLELPNVSPGEQAIARSHLGMVAWLAGQLKEAEKWCKQAVAGLFDLGNRVDLAGAYNRLGLVYFSMGRLAEAGQLFNDALNVRRELRDDWGCAYCLGNLAKVAIEQEEFEQAESLLGQAEQIFNHIESRDGLMVIYTNRGRALLAQHGVDEAVIYLGRALNLAMEINKWSSYGLGDIYLLMAEAELQRRQYDRAEQAICEALRLVETAGNREYIATGYMLQARLRAARGHLDQAIPLIQQAIALYEKVGSRPGVIRARQVYVGLLAEQGLTDQAAVEMQRVLAAGGGHT